MSSSRGKQASGFKDKLYWRETSDGGMHCFKSYGNGGRQVELKSLCNRFTRLGSGGQASRRPEPVLRCALCDAREAQRRGWQESGPTLEPRLSKPRAGQRETPKKQDEEEGERSRVLKEVYGGVGGDLLASWKKDIEETKCCGLICLPGVFTRLFMAKEVNRVVEEAVHAELKKVVLGLAEVSEGGAAFVRGVLQGRLDKKRDREKRFAAILDDPEPSGDDE